ALAGLLTSGKSSSSNFFSNTIDFRYEDAWNEAGKWPREASDMAGAAGLTGLYAPEELGGQGLSLAEGIQI
ncbi:MAG: acyl-CoA dehydrogenase family protein, partial [Pseudomonadota bacterium]